MQVRATNNSCPWTASSTSNLNPTITSGTGTGTASGMGNATVALTYPANNGVTPLSLSAVVAGQGIAISQSGMNCTVSLSASSTTIGSGGGPGSVDVTTQPGCPYATVNGPGWLSVTSNGSGTGPNPVMPITLGFSATPNTQTTPRSGSLHIAGQTFQVSQDALSCSVTVDASGLGNPFSSGGGTGTIAITTSAPNCPWTASSSASWAVPTPPAGVSNGTLTTITVTVGSNASSTAGRSATLTVAGQTVGVSQAGTVCTYVLGSLAATVPNAGGSGSVTVNAASACTWSSTPDASAPWLTITRSGTSGTADIAFTATANTSSSPRSGIIKVGQGSLLLASFTVNQAAAPCAFTLGTTTLNAPASGTSGSFTFSTSATGCTATAVSFSSWIHVTSTQPVTTQTGSIAYTVDANTSSSGQTGTIQFAGQMFAVSQAPPVCNYRLRPTSALWTTGGGSGTTLGTVSNSGCFVPNVSANMAFVGVTTPTGPVSNIFTEIYTIAPFVSSTRSTRKATIIFGGRPFKIKQKSW